MPDILDANGLQTKSLTEITSDLTTGMQAIYGADINVDSNSPDGQLIGIFAQAAIDIRELLQSVYASFDPNQALGVALTERSTINNVQRKGGTFTIVPIVVVTNATVVLQGLDAAADDVNGTGYTISDNSGNQYILLNSATITSGTHTVNFRAQTIGAVTPTVNTIINPVTIVLGVTSVNNAAGALEIGQNEETDSQLRIRRSQSVSNGSTGYLNGLEGGLLALSGVNDARVYENDGDTTDANGIPAHGIWAIVEGGSTADIAQQIYSRKSDGANMKGSITVPIVTVSGTVFVVKFDRPTAQSLYIRFNIQKTMTTATFNTTQIATYIVANETYNIGQYAGASDLYAVAQAAINAGGGNGFPTELQISLDGTTYVDYLTPTTLDKQFVLDISKIAITVL